MKKLQFLRSILSLVLVVATIMGTSTITAKSKYYIFISKNPGILYLTDGGSKQLTIKLNAPGFKNLTKKCKYKVANPRVCSVKKGKIVAKKEGTTTVYAKYKSAKTSIKVNVANSHYSTDIKNFLEKNDYTHFNLIKMDPSKKFNMLVACKVNPADNKADAYDFYTYDFSTNDKKGKGEYLISKAAEPLGLKYRVDGVPAIDYSKKMGLFYGMSYSTVFKNDPLKPSSLYFREIFSAGYADLLKKDYDRYTGNTVWLGINTEQGKNNTPVHYMGQTYYLSNSNLNTFNEVYANASTLKLVENTAANRNSIIR